MHIFALTCKDWIKTKPTKPSVVANLKLCNHTRDNEGNKKKEKGRKYPQPSPAEIKSN